MMTLPETSKRKNDAVTTSRLRQSIFLIVLLIIGIGSVGFLWWQGSQPKNDLPTARLLYPSGASLSLMSLNLQTGQQSQIKVEYDSRSIPSPDGKAYAYWKDLNICCDSILTVSDVNLGVYSGSSHTISWSPDGQWIAFSAEPRAKDYYENWSEEDVWSSMYEELYLANWTTREIVRLTDNGSIDRFPAFSPDGMQIVYTSDADGQNRLYIMDIATKTSRLLTPDMEGNQAVWSPDGQWIAFLSNYTEATYDRSPTGDLWLIHADGTGAQMIKPSINGGTLLWLP